MKLFLLCYRKLVAAGKAEDRLRARTLQDIEPGTVLEVFSFKETKTSVGEAVVLSVTETVSGPKGMERDQYSLMIAGRFKEECEAKVPCVALYTGMKETKGGQMCHDLKFVKCDDKEVFRKSDETLVIPSSDEEDMEEMPPPPPLRKEAPSSIPIPKKVDCRMCAIDGMDCIGECEDCGVHLPLNGSQCRCRIKKYKY